MKASKLTLLHYYLLTRHRSWSSRESLERWQEARIVRHLSRVRLASAFYRQHWGILPVTDWRTFPLIDKKLMMERFDELNTAGIRKEQALETALSAERTRNFRPMLGDITVGLSSGTSGSRGLFLVGPHERMAWAGAVLAKVLPRSLLHGERVAFFLRADSNLYGTVRGGRLQFRFHDLLEPMDRHIATLEKDMPTMLVAPPSVLRLLAGAALNGRLRIHPHRIVSVAEVLDPLDRLYIERAFGQTVHQIYQCTEGFLAATCRHGTLHLNEDIVCIQKEYIDAGQRKFVPVITDFSRFTQPIVRYRLNDLLTERSEPCSCGSPMTAIEAIEGRCDDLFELPSLRDAGATVTVFPDLLSRAVICSSPHIEEYKLIQVAPDRLELALRIAGHAMREPVEASAVRSLADLCGKLGCRMPFVAFVPYEHEPDNRKLRRVERRWVR
ncbi:MAG: adenylate cyclase [Paenibacillus sp.]|jgi:putative adenylate-forming enzyme|nr:adenylate cyclase [Paenibacillus sp.]